MFPVGAFGTTRTCQQPLQLGEHHLPANTALLINFYSIFNSPDCWDRPEQFLPVWLFDAKDCVVSWHHRCSVMKIARATLLSQNTQGVAGWDITRLHIERLTSVLHMIDALPTGCPTNQASLRPSEPS